MTAQMGTNQIRTINIIVETCYWKYNCRYLLRRYEEKLLCFVKMIVSWQVKHFCIYCLEHNLIPNAKSGLNLKKKKIDHSCAHYYIAQKSLTK